MGKELIRKAIAAGIVPTHAVQQLKAWKQLSEDFTDEEWEQLSKSGLLESVQDIESILEEHGELPEIRETVPGMDALFAAKSRDCIVILNVARQTLSMGLPALKERDCIVFKADGYGETASRVGNQLSLDGDKVFEVTETTPLYRGEDVSFYRCKVQEVPEHAQVSELRGTGR